MRGQVSIEFLIVLAIFLAVLGFWLGGVNQVSQGIGFALSKQQTQLAVDKVIAGINSVCVMGHGNSITLEVVVLENASVSYKNNLLEWSSTRVEKTVHCGFNDFSVSGKQFLVFENNNGFVSVHAQRMNSTSV